MNQNLSEYIYQHYQTDQYYRKYLKETGKRKDNRMLHEHRPIKINIANNSVILNLGQTTIIAQIQSRFQSLVYSPVTQTYGQDLIKIVVNPYNQSGNPNKYERNASKAIEQFVTYYLFNEQNHSILREIEKQLVCEIQQKNGTKQLYGFILTINLIIAGNDGGLAEYSLLASSILLWTTKIQLPHKIQAEHPNLKINPMLNLSHFIFPIRYCQVLDQILVDPSELQALQSNFQVVIMKNLLQSDKSKHPIVNQQAHKGDSPSLYIDSLLKLYETQISKLGLNIKQIKERVQKGDRHHKISINNI